MENKEFTLFISLHSYEKIISSNLCIQPTIIGGFADDEQFVLFAFGLICRSL
jgi:hypothetical protein